MDIEGRNKIIEDIYKTGLIQNYIKKLGYQADLEEYNDIVQECFVQLLEVKTDKWEDLLSQAKANDKYFAVRGYISGIVYRQVRSRNSRVYAKYKKHKEFEYTQSDKQWEALKNIADLPFDYEQINLECIDNE